ncbi:hypothetical protein [Burkholderia sp. Ac-20379]|uniref:hypothetical protein n=1 Tax=Burkholderia sp. Ac-20379 TaxID=2703900 RepID=UPI00197DB744|nr:hypothetical protein [Burkholderia sp. Ac-20379]MBN3724605.1 hypothetical protein [Burkholderia sp. Ac-20379]
MNSFEKILERLSGDDWRPFSQGYTPTKLEMDGVMQCLKAISSIARRYDATEGAHVLSSSARLMGFTPTLEVESAINERLETIQNAYAKVIVKNAMEWAAMISVKELSPDFQVDLFEPLLSLIGRGCHIGISKGFFDVGGNNIPLHGWPVIAAKN